MDGRMDGWMDGWMDGRTNERADGRGFLFTKNPSLQSRESPYVSAEQTVSGNECACVKYDGNQQK